MPFYALTRWTEVGSGCYLGTGSEKEFTEANSIGLIEKCDAKLNENICIYGLKPRQYAGLPFVQYFFNLYHNVALCSINPRKAQANTISTFF